MVPRQTRVLQVDPVHPSADALAGAARLLRDGGLVVFPTETVYGLGAHARDVSAIRGIFDAKGRPSSDPLIVHVASVGDVAGLARVIPDALPRLASRFWPGPLTMIVPRHADIPDLVTAGLDTVAVRVPAHPVAQALLRAAGVPVAAPSANTFSRPSPTQASHVLADLEGRVDLVVDGGQTNIGLESTVLDLTVDPPVVRRPGGVSIDALRAVLPDVQVVQRVIGEGVPQVSPGQLLRHYAPKARMTLFEGESRAVRARVLADARALLARGLRVGLLAPDEDVEALQLALVADTPALAFQQLGSRQDPDSVARHLFDAIRRVDAARPDEILAIGVGHEGIGLAIHDRLTRASEGRVVHL